MNNWVFETATHQLPKDLLNSEVTTSKGRLYLLNDDIGLGPKYLIRINAPLEKSQINWELFNSYIGGSNEAVCRQLFSACNGLSFSWRFTVPGILTDNPYDGKGDSSFNVPYDMGTLSYRGYPAFAPNDGYFVGSIRIGSDGKEVCDIITAEGDIVYGEFKESSAVMGSFKSLQDWLDERVRQVLLEMATDGLISEPSI